METIQPQKVDTVVVGAGLTGLTTAHTLRQKGIDVWVIEKENRIGGQIRTYPEAGFTFESGPNTGVIANPEVAELFSSLEPFGCRLITANEEARQRWIWKRGQFHLLPVGLKGSIYTSLFSWYDKFRILGEPFRAKGTDPDESVAQLVARRLGRSYVDYAVDPFIGGIYAGDPSQLVTRFALPKLYNLEQTYGSFIRGAIAKMREPKSPRDRLATREVFSVEGGLEQLIAALGRAVGPERIVLGAQNTCITPVEEGWKVAWQRADGTPQALHCRQVVTTIGAYALPSLLPFVSKEQIMPFTQLRYAPIIQVSVGIKDVRGRSHRAFGGLVPSCEHRPVLGVLFPSSCFAGRAPQGGEVYSFFLGGIRHPEMFDKSDADITQIILTELREMLALPADMHPALIRIFRHRHAIPQYEQSSNERLASIKALERQFDGLTIAGNLRDGIGMADRIKQGCTLF